LPVLHTQVLTNHRNISYAVIIRDTVCEWVPVSPNTKVLLHVCCYGKVKFTSNLTWRHKGE